MKAYIYNGKQVIKKNVPKPKIRNNDVLVKIDKVSICGSDFHIFNNDDWAKETVDKGIVIGHEGCGVVKRIGKDVKKIKVGDYVALESHYACPKCEAQDKGIDECDHYGIIGVHETKNKGKRHQVGGVFSEYISIPHYCCHKISKKLRNAFSSSLLEPAGNSWEIMKYIMGPINKSSKKISGKVPKSIAIHGCGPHGLNLQLFAKYLGIKKIVVFEVDDNRLKYAKKFGVANKIVDVKKVKKREHFNKYDVAVDMVGNKKVVDFCKKQVKNNGIVILFGLPKHEELVQDGENFAEIIFNNEEKEINFGAKKFTLRGITGRSQKTWKELLSALNKSELLREKLGKPLEFIGTLDELERFIKNKPKGFIKIGMNQFE